MKVPIAVIAATCIVWLATARAAEVSVPFSGAVFSLSSDGSRDMIPGATVTLVPEACERCGRVHRPSRSAGPRWDAVVDSTGKYTISAVPPGHYMLSASFDGMVAEERLIEADLGTSIVADIEMKVAAVRQSVSVTAADDAIETTATSVAGALEERALEHAPSAEERLTSALPLLAGVVRSADGTIYTKGARDTQNGFLVNNASVTDPVTGGTTVNLPLDVVSNVQVMAGPYDTQYGQFSGALTAVETRESNFEKFHFELQNVMPRPRKRNGTIMGIANSSPRVTVTGPLLGKGSLLRNRLSTALSGHEFPRCRI